MSKTSKELKKIRKELKRSNKIAGNVGKKGIELLLESMRGIIGPRKVPTPTESKPEPRQQPDPLPLQATEVEPCNIVLKWDSLEKGVTLPDRIDSSLKRQIRSMIALVIKKLVLDMEIAAGRTSPDEPHPQAMVNRSEYLALLNATGAISDLVGIAFNMGVNSVTPSAKPEAAVPLVASADELKEVSAAAAAKLAGSSKTPDAPGLSVAPGEPEEEPEECCGSCSACGTEFSDARVEADPTQSPPQIIG